MRIRSVKWFGLKLLVVILLLSGVAAVRAAAGDLDPGFNASAYWLGVNETVNIIKRQPDGKYLIGGKFTRINGIAAGGLARLNADLTVDASFNPYEFTDLNYTAAVIGLGIQSDGKIVVVTSVPLQPTLVRRILPDGTLDAAFQTIGLGYQSASDVEILAGDKILVGGQLFNADGTPVNSFPGLISGGYATAFQTDGKILAGNGVFRRYNADGSVDNSYQVVTTNGTVGTIVYLPDGKSLIGGAFSGVNGFPVRGLARINADGTPDLTFNQNLAGLNGSVYDIILKTDGKILIAGDFTSYNGVPRTRLAQLNPDGSLDNSFQTPDLSGQGAATDIETLPNGKVLVGFNGNSNSSAPLRVFNADGSADVPLNLIFGRGGVGKILQQPDGKILIFSGFDFVNGVARNSAARLNPDGSLDASFVPDLPPAPLGISSAALLPDGRILVGGYNVFVRLNADGSRDTSFSVTLANQDTVSNIVPLPDGRILAQGNLTHQGIRFPRVLRYNANGSLDAGFNVPGTNDAILTFARQPDGKIVIAGAFTMIDSVQRVRIARLNADGTLDTAFSPPGGANNLVWDMELQADGKIVLGGAFTGLNGSTNQNRVGRLNPDGTLDTSFVQPLTISDTAVGIKVQTDGKVFVWGSFDSVGATPKTGIVRFNANGSLDPTFNLTVNKPASPSHMIGDVYLQPDGRILLGGFFTRVNGAPRSGIVRLYNNLVARAPFDYDGDGKADVSVFRPSENKWYVLQSSNNAVVQTVFAVAGDVPTPADFDGDGKTDPAVFRPGSGDWWYRSSLSGAPVNVNWGQAGDIPRPSDFDGDGKADFVVYRPSNGVWYRLGSTGQTSITAFGTGEDKPLVGDFDGDGKSDPAVFRPSTGDWWYAASASNNQFAVVHWGQAGDIPVPGDYDADGKTDFVVYRPSNGGWYILRSGEQNYTILQFGTAEDKPVAADFDGDGKADVAVWRPSSGTWYLLQTTSGFGAVQWGATGDVPTENAFLP